MSNKSEENFRFLGRTFDIQKAIEMVARGDVVDQGEIAIKDIWKWINVIEIDKDYASQITADRLETPVIVAKLANEDLLIDGYHRLAKAIAVGRKTLPFVSIDGDDVLLESESLFKAKPPKHLTSRMREMNRKGVETMKFAIIQDGICILGRGNSIDDCIDDANQWLDNDQQITGFEAHDQRGLEVGGLTDWTSGRRYPLAGDFFITDDSSVIREYEVKK